MTEMGPALGYILEYWRLHPDALLYLDQIEWETQGTDAYRAWLYDEINAATDGDLARCIPMGPHNFVWIFLVGMACAETMKVDG